MKYIRDNKVMLLKYLSVVVSNILLYILVSFYFRNVENNFLILFVVVAIFDYIIFNYKDKIKYNYLLDIICCIFSGIILNFFIKIDLLYSINIFCIYFPNNIIFMKSRESNKFFGRLLQYLITVIITIFVMYISLLLRKIF